MLLHHCSNFRVSSNSWNAQRQGGLSSDSNSIPATMIPGLHLFQVLMESFPLLITHWSQVFRKPVHMWKQVVHLDAHVAAQVSENSQHVVDKFCIVSGLIAAKKVLHYQNKCLPRFQFHFVHWVFELWISVSCRIWGPSKMPAFNFSMVNPGKAWHK